MTCRYVFGLLKPFVKVAHAVVVIGLAFGGTTAVAKPTRLVHGMVQGKKPTHRGKPQEKAPQVSGTVEAPPPMATKPVEAAPVKEVSAATAPRGPTRVDFDDRLIQGQSNKSGAVYLFDRKESALRSMVHRRTSFRDEIVKDVLD